MLLAALVLALAVVLGTVAHELSHAIALRCFRIPHSVDWFPERGGSTALPIGLRGQWAEVTPGPIPPDLATWKLRIAAIMPFCLLLPVTLVLLGAVENPLPIAGIHATLAAIGWTACAIPSPADFSIFWHPQRSIAAAG